MSVALETVDLQKRFGGIVATDTVSLRIDVGARHALIGPNGAGKTTFVNLLTGVLPPSAGRVLLDRRDITRETPERRVRLGLARTFQINQLFLTLSPAEAIAIAINERDRRGWSLFERFGRSIASEVDEVAERFRLRDVIAERVGTLPYGKQRLLELALAFACRPRVLLLDEPAAGVPEAERKDILDAVSSLPQSVAVLLIEHDMDLVFSFAQRITVMVAGAVFRDGPASDIARDPAVQAVYLGEAADDA